MRSTGQPAGVWAASWVGIYLLFGLAFQLLYFGLPWPQHFATWLHVAGWPAYVGLGMLRRLFIPFAFLALLGFAALLLVRRWTRTER